MSDSRPQRRPTTGLADRDEAFDFEWPADFRMPTIEEIEQDLALGNPGWKGLLTPPATPPRQIVDSGRDHRRPRLARTVTLVTLAVVLGFAIGTSVSTAAGSGPGHAIARTASTNACPRFVWTARGPVRIYGLVCSR